MDLSNLYTILSVSRRVCISQLDSSGHFGKIDSNEINQLHPVNYIHKRELELHVRYLGILTILHTTNHNHEWCSGICQRFSANFLPMCCPKSVTSYVLSQRPFPIASPTLPAHLFRNISIQWHQIHSAWSKLFNGSQMSQVSKEYVTIVTLGNRLLWSWFEQLCPCIMYQCFFS